MDKSYLGMQRTHLNPKTDHGMAHDPHNREKRYGMQAGDNDNYRGITFERTPHGTFCIRNPKEVAGEYTTLKYVLAAIDKYQGATNEGS